MSIICPKCGRDDDSKVKFIDAFCVDCYPIRVEAPSKFGMQLCKSCGMMYLKGEWMPYNREEDIHVHSLEMQGRFHRSDL